ncbi:methylmalonyl-CoA epimerase [Nonomuraea guangzhouensis]|uniref:Methylmalonyl-CoA epimerase n=1 Tax=Nonomuraea guangzhouensis TaxID=1291555 RepID=A0ABW4GC49_9ACTN|nr:methylmalonyl-CoA epimerase [Nonomuraea guangzhouensis]
MFMRIDHIGIACHDLEAKIALFSDTFELTVVAREVNEEQGVREAMLHIADGEGGSSYIQLLEPLSPDTPVGKFLAKRGEGVHHVAFGVPDVAEAMERLAGKGVRLLDERPRHGSMGSEIAFAHPKDVGGMLTELVQAAGAPANVKTDRM